MNAAISPVQKTLYYREGSSDKVYQVAIEPAGERFTVNFAYGRRGTTLQTGTKTNVPVEHDKALTIFGKLVKEKTAKGYTEGETGTPYQHTDQQQFSGIQCQLLNPIEPEAVERFILDPEYCAQEKFDGRRLLVYKEGAAIHGINRRGLMVGLPSVMVQAVHQMTSDFIIDGECVGEVLHAFDLLMLNGEELRTLSYKVRYLSLMNLLFASHQQQIALVPWCEKAQDKTRLLAELKAQKKEGIVFKQMNAPYTLGRPNSGGSQFKHKFYATVSAVVAKINAKRSVEVRLMNCAGWVPAGNVTIPVNFNVPQVGSVVEIRYLYAFKESGSLFQPTYLGERSDVELSECKTTQLKYKATDSEDQ